MPDEGAAIEARISGLFPPRVQLPPPNPPGATRSTNEPMFEKDEMKSCLVDDATVMAVEMQPGELTWLVEPLLPAAIAVATPAAFRLSIGVLRLLVSQEPVNRPPPMLMFAEARLTPTAGWRPF